MVSYKGVRATRGERMRKGPWRLMHKNNRKVFVGTLIETLNIGNTKVAIFSVRK